MHEIHEAMPHVSAGRRSSSGLSSPAVSGQRTTQDGFALLSVKVVQVRPPELGHLLDESTLPQYLHAKVIKAVPLRSKVNGLLRLDQ